MDEWVEVSWTPVNRNRYALLGYKFTKMRDKFLVLVEHLPDGSHIKVNTECPICKAVKQKKYQDIIKVGHTLCRGCACIREMKNIKIGRLTMIDIDYERSGSRVIWWKCICDCGTEFSIRRCNLISSTPTVSCGCYAIERIKAQCGENHYNWNPDLTDEERVANRHSKEDKQWRRDVYERDNYTCQVCGDKTGGNFEAHHLYSYKHHPDKRLDINNGITLCKHEHIEFHSYMGGTSSDCTPDDFEKWKKEKLK